jgi:hypothetical protein
MGTLLPEGVCGFWVMGAADVVLEEGSQNNGGGDAVVIAHTLERMNSM